MSITLSKDLLIKCGFQVNTLNIRWESDVFLDSKIYILENQIYFAKICIGNIKVFERSTYIYINTQTGLYMLHMDSSMMLFNIKNIYCAIAARMLIEQACRRWNQTVPISWLPKEIKKIILDYVFKWTALKNFIYKIL
jgi:hypothetical protein